MHKSQFESNNNDRKNNLADQPREWSLTFQTSPAKKATVSLRHMVWIGNEAARRRWTKNNPELLAKTSSALRGPISLSLFYDAHWKCNYLFHWMCVVLKILICVRARVHSLSFGAWKPATAATATTKTGNWYPYIITNVTKSATGNDPIIFFMEHTITHILRIGIVHRTANQHYLARVRLGDCWWYSLSIHAVRSVFILCISQKCLIVYSAQMFSSSQSTSVHFLSSSFYYYKCVYVVIYGADQFVIHIVFVFFFALCFTFVLCQCWLHDVRVTGKKYALSYTVHCRILTGIK